MRPARHSELDLDDLILAVMHHDSDNGLLQQLDEWLRSDEVAARRYLELCQFECDLQRLLREGAFS